MRGVRAKALRRKARETSQPSQLMVEKYMVNRKGKDGKAYGYLKGVRFFFQGFRRAYQDMKKGR